MAKKLVVPEDDYEDDDDKKDDMSIEDRRLGASELKTLVDLRQAIQGYRVAMGNRALAIELGRSTGNKATFEDWHEQFQILEERCDEQIRDLSDGVQIIEDMCRVKGVGKLLAAQIVSSIDITKADTVSALWRYSGYGVGDDGLAERRKRGERIYYNTALKTILYKLATSFMRSKSPYSDEYYRAREFYENEREWTKAHCHRAALRKMIKMFLAHLWIHWRTLEGLPTRSLYVIDKLGHSTYIDGKDYGWSFDED